MQRGDRCAVVILGAHPWYDKGVWKTNGLDGPGDHAGPTFDRFRVLAASCLAGVFPEALLIPSGGRVVDGAPTIAIVVCRELVELGVSIGRIVLENESRNTYEQLRNVARLSRKAKLQKLIIVSNEWHLPRIEAMIFHAPGMEDWKMLSWESQAAEEVMLNSARPEWEDLVKCARMDPRLVARISGEQKGVEQIRSGTYRYHPQP